MSPHTHYRSLPGGLHAAGANFDDLGMDTISLGGGWRTSSRPCARLASAR